MNPANYYLHLVCLYPLFVAEPLPRKKSRREGFPVTFTAAADSTSTKVALILLLMCASHYFAVLVQDRHIRFYQLSFSIVAGLATLLFVLLRRDGPDLLAALSPAPAGHGDDLKDEDKDEDEDGHEHDRGRHRPSWSEGLEVPPLRTVIVSFFFLDRSPDLLIGTTFPNLLPSVPTVQRSPVSVL
jgi:hypothetical protein